MENLFWFGILIVVLIIIGVGIFYLCDGEVDIDPSDWFDGG